MSADPPRILVIKLGAFGDVVQADGALRDIRAHHPDARIVALTAPAYRRILERCPWVNDVIVDPRVPRWRLDRMLALRRTLRSRRFDRVYDLQNSRRTAWYFRWMLREVEWSGTAPGCTLPHRERDPKRIPALQRLAGQLRDAGVPVRHTLAPDVGWMADDVTDVLRARGIDGGYIAIVPGASARHPHKRWPHFDALVRALQARRHAVVFAPGPDDLDLAARSPATVLMRGDGGWLDWFALAGVLRGARFVVGNDTGPSHLAAHLGTPGVALFGPHVDAARTGIERGRFRAISSPDLASIDVARVLAAVESGLAQ